MKIVTRRTDFGPALIEHFWLEVGCDRAVACSGADAGSVLEVKLGARGFILEPPHVFRVCV